MSLTVTAQEDVTNFRILTAKMRAAVAQRC
jgi:hypothetical protein